MMDDAVHEINIDKQLGSDEGRKYGGYSDEKTQNVRNAPVEPTDDRGNDVGEGGVFHL